MRNELHPNDWSLRGAIRCSVDLAQCRPKTVLTDAGHEIVVDLKQGEVSVRLRHANKEIHDFTCSLVGDDFLDKEDAEEGRAAFLLHVQQGRYQLGIDINEKPRL